VVVDELIAEANKQRNNETTTTTDRGSTGWLAAGKDGKMVMWDDGSENVVCCDFSFQPLF